MEVTKREILFSTIILAIMIGLGVWISNPIVSSLTKNALETVSAVQAKDSDKFGYIKRTNAGRFLAEGPLVANDTITIPDIPGQFSYIEKVKEVYTMHTQVYTTTDGKGHVRTHTRTYWSWDVKGREEFETADYNFLGENFTKKEIGYRGDCEKDTTIYNKKFWGSNVRYVYYTTPVAVEGLMTGVADGKSYNDLKFTRNVLIEDRIESAERKILSIPIVFWTLWIILTGAVITLFYVLENKWLY